jgi:predicted 2-oxoglutarate/Fe(II)-dependent dioxygenase YbiX
MRPEWREIAKQQEAEIGKPRDEAYDRETVAEIRSRLDQAQPIVGEEAHLGGDEAAYIVIRRQVPVRKGKWRMVSKEVEEAEREN